MLKNGRHNFETFFDDLIYNSIILSFSTIQFFVFPNDIPVTLVTYIFQLQFLAVADINQFIRLRAFRQKKSFSQVEQVQISLGGFVFKSFQQELIIDSIIIIYYSQYDFVAYIMNKQCDQCQCRQFYRLYNSCISIEPQVPCPVFYLKHNSNQMLRF